MNEHVKCWPSWRSGTEADCKRDGNGFGMVRGK